MTFRKYHQRTKITSRKVWCVRQVTKLAGHKYNTRKCCCIVISLSGSREVSRFHSRKGSGIVFPCPARCRTAGSVFHFHFSTLRPFRFPTTKKLKYIRKLEPWQHTPNKFTLHNAQSLLGTLVHCTLAITDGRSRLPALTRFVSSFSGKSPFSTRTPIHLLYVIFRGGTIKFPWTFADLTFNGPLQFQLFLSLLMPPPPGVLVLSSVALGQPGNSLTASGVMPGRSDGRR